MGVRVASNLQELQLESHAREIEQVFSELNTRVLTVANSVSQDQRLVKALQQRNITEIDTVINGVRGTNAVDFVTVTDQNGIVLSRTIENGIRGDYLYDSTSYGYSLSQGNTVSSIERTLFFPLASIGAVPIHNDGTIVGSLIVGEVLDESLAQELHSTIPNTHFIFYAHDRGITGTSFASREVDEVIRTNLDTTIVNTEAGELPIKRIAVEGRVFDLYEIEFPGTSGSIGGVLILFEKNAVRENIIIAAVVTILYFSVLVMYLVFNNRAGVLLRKHLETGVIMSSAVILLLFSSFYTAGGVLSRSIIRIEKPVYPIYNSTMKIEPASGVFSIQSQQRASIVLETGGEPINVAHVIVHYDTNKIRIDQIDTEKTFCDESLFIRRDIDDVNGTVTISCGKARPGFTDTIGIVGELVFTPLIPGEFALSFDDDSQILAHDGLGTNVLRSSVGGSYSAVEGDLLSNTSTSTLIFSTTHPNGEQWYSERTVQFSWRNREADGYYISFDQHPTTTPLRSTPLATTSAEVVALADGIYYLHVQAVKDSNLLGNTAHYKVKIDATPPDRPIIKASKTRLEKGETMRLEFMSSDAMSGLQNSYYYIKFNNGILFPMRSPVYAAFPEEGVYNITIRAFDNAGNTSDAEVVITVEDGARFLWRLFRLPANVIYFLSTDTF